MVQCEVAISAMWIGYGGDHSNHSEKQNQLHFYVYLLSRDCQVSSIYRYTAIQWAVFPMETFPQNHSNACN